MTHLDQNEIEHRFRGIQDGPWTKRAAPAWSKIALPRLPSGFSANQAADLTKSRFPGGKEKSLVKLLAPHWEEDIEDEECHLRDAFDEALGVFSLYELAVETGYLPLEDVARRERERLIRLLWSGGARGYVRTYEYFGVAFLASRLNVEIGYAPYNPPPIHQASESRFAYFLSQRRMWYTEELDLWLGLLDDYQVLEDEDYDKDIFAEFLATTDGDFADVDTLWEMVTGADRFTVLLADLSNALGTDELPRYGLLHLYWVARFFGYDLGRKGYKRSKDHFDWSKLLLGSKRLRADFRQLQAVQDRLQPQPTGAPPDALWKQYQADLRDRIRHIDRLWTKTLNFLASQ